nr:VapE domain-containing protein [uncultured Bacteroides sp.]
MSKISSPKVYFKNLPEWDGTDHLTAFINRVQTTNQALWTETLTKWLCNVVRSELYGTQDKTIIPLIYGEQSSGKTTFIRSILSPQLEEYYSEKLIGTYNEEIKPLLGPIMLHSICKECHIDYDAIFYKDLYKKKKTGNRVPSLIYTTHMRQEECCEPFVYFEATKHIDNESPVNYEQLYAQIMQKLGEE